MGKEYFQSTFGDFVVYVIKSGRWHQNGYLVINSKSKDAYIIDPGGKPEVFISIIEKEKFKLKSIFLTHAHHDHVGGLKGICDMYNIGFHIEKNDYKIFRRAPMFALTFEARNLEIPLGREIYYEEDFFDNQNCLYALKAPGHTKGGVVVIIDKLVFTGDTLLNKMVGRTDLPGACPELLAESITAMFRDLADESILFPGHGTHWTVDEAKAWWLRYKNDAPEYREEN